MAELEPNMGRVERVEEIIKTFKNLEYLLEEGHFLQRSKKELELARNAALEEYTKPEIELAKTRLWNQARNEGFAAAVNRGDIPQWADWTEYP